MRLFNRKPKGMPTGGEFANKRTSESETWIESTTDGSGGKGGDANSGYDNHQAVEKKMMTGWSKAVLSDKLGHLADGVDTDSISLKLGYSADGKTPSLVVSGMVDGETVTADVAIMRDGMWSKEDGIEEWGKSEVIDFLYEYDSLEPYPYGVDEVECGVLFLSRDKVDGPNLRDGDLDQIFDLEKEHSDNFYLSNMDKVAILVSAYDSDGKFVTFKEVNIGRYENGVMTDDGRERVSYSSYNDYYEDSESWWDDDDGEPWL